MSKIYDYVVGNYLEIYRQQYTATKQFSYKINVVHIFITPYSVAKRSENSPSTMESSLRSVANISLAEIGNHLTFVADFAASMPKFIGAHVSERS